MPRSDFYESCQLGIQELSHRSGCSVASIKFYLREGLLFAGEMSQPHRAYYDERHLRRLVSIRAMRDAGISIEAMRRAFDAVHAAGADVVDVIAPAIDALAIPRSAPGEDAVLRQARKDVDALFDQEKLVVRKDAGSRETLARALASLRRVGSPVAITDVATYLDALRPVAQREIEFESTRALLLSDKEASLEIAVLGTVLYEPILLGLRRALHEHFTSKLVRTPRAARKSGQSSEGRNTRRKTGPKPR